LSGSKAPIGGSNIQPGSVYSRTLGYQGDPPGHDLRQGAHDMVAMGIQNLSGSHLRGVGFKQGDAIVGPDPSTGKEDILFNARVLSESQV
jgi:hypothetical protein